MPVGFLFFLAWYLRALFLGDLSKNVILCIIQLYAYFYYLASKTTVIEQKFLTVNPFLICILYFVSLCHIYNYFVMLILLVLFTNIYIHVFLYQLSNIWDLLFSIWLKVYQWVDYLFFCFTFFVVTFSVFKIIEWVNLCNTLKNIISLSIFFQEFIYLCQFPESFLSHLFKF